jgi:hypothetical protein
LIVGQGPIREAGSGISKGTRQHGIDNEGYEPAIIVIMKAAGR